MKIWISYSMSDRKFVDRLSNDLKKEGIETILYDNTIAYGENIFDKTYDAIKDADAYIIVLSERSVKSNWVSSELGLMLSESREANKPLIPLVIDPNINIPPFINQFQYANLSTKDRYNSEFEKILNGLRKSNKRKGRIDVIEQNIKNQKELKELEFQQNKLELQKNEIRNLKERLQLDLIKEEQRMLELEKERYHQNSKRKLNLRTYYLTIAITLIASFSTVYFFAQGPKEFSFLPFVYLGLGIAIGLIPSLIKFFK